MSHLILYYNVIFHAFVVDCRLFSKLTFSKNSFRNTFSAKWFGSWFGSKLFAKFINRWQKSPIAREEFIYFHNFFVCASSKVCVTEQMCKLLRASESSLLVVWKRPKFYKLLKMSMPLKLIACWAIFHAYLCLLLIFFNKKFFRNTISVSYVLHCLIWVQTVCKEISRQHNLSQVGKKKHLTPAKPR